MTAPVTITFEAAPQAKARPRFGRYGVYTPTQTRSFESAVKWIAKVQMRGRQLLRGPVKLDVAFDLPPPRNFLKPKRQNPFPDFAIAKPDLDNLTKSILDALSGIVVADDAQIVRLIAVKRYGAKPKVTAIITPLAEEGA